MRFILLFRTFTGSFAQRVTPEPKDLDVRLMDGPTGNEGRIEIFVSEIITNIKNETSILPK